MQFGSGFEDARVDDVADDLEEGVIKNPNVSVSVCMHARDGEPKE